MGVPHEIKGQGIYAFVSTKKGTKTTEQLKAALIQHVRDTYGPIATPEVIQWTTDLPKTRSGKIMRRILRKIASNALSDLGDVSTLANPEVIDALLAESKKISSSRSVVRHS